MTANKKKLKIAITGGIGSGKSAVSSAVVSLGQTVYNADEIYSELLNDERVALNCCKIVGVEPKYVSGRAVFDKSAAAPIVFSDGEIRKKLNDYTHALVYKRIDELFDKFAGDIVFFEIPLLFESGKEKDFDYVIIVSRDRGERIKSVMLRDGVDKKRVDDIISSQYDYDNIPDIKHTILRNDGNLKSLYNKVEDIVEKLKKGI